jgi:hypothetical protein
MVTRIVNKTVRPGGWTEWSFVHILTVTRNVVGTLPHLCLPMHFMVKQTDEVKYLLWPKYFRVPSKAKVSKLALIWWAQPHFGFHVSLILLLRIKDYCSMRYLA